MERIVPLVLIVWVTAEQKLVGAGVKLTVANTPVKVVDSSLVKVM